MVSRPIPDLDTEPHSPGSYSDGPTADLDTKSAETAPDTISFFDHTAKDDPASTPTLSDEPVPPEVVDDRDELKPQVLPTPTVKTPPAPPPSESVDIFASWDEGKDYFVKGITTGVIPAPQRKLDRRVWWLTIALVISLAAQLGGVIAVRLLPPLFEAQHAAELTYERVRKSARSLDRAKRVGVAIPERAMDLQRQAETAAFAGDWKTAAAKVEAVQEAWQPR